MGNSEPSLGSKAKMDRY